MAHARSIISSSSRPNVTLIWLDQSFHTSDNTDLLEELRNDVEKVETFTDVNRCEKSIKGLSKNVKILMILSGRMGREIVPRIHELPQIVSIYIFCQDVESYKKFAEQYKKVKISS